MVDVSQLVQPPAERLLRQPDATHIAAVKNSILKEGAILAQTHMLVGNINIPVNDFDLEKLKSYQIEVLGGNHTRLALQELQEPKQWGVVLYAGMSILQNLH